MSAEQIIVWEEERGSADPLADQKAYFAKWELRRIARMEEQREDAGSLSIYEQSRLRPIR